MAKDEQKTSDGHLTRRELLTRGAGAVLATGAAVAGGYWLYDPRGDAGLRKATDAARRLKNYFAEIELPPSGPRISVATGPESDAGKLVRNAVAGLGRAKGIGRFIAKGDIVLVKPNVGFDRAPHLGATTNPEVLSAVIALCKEAGAARVIVADNPIESPEACFAKSKIGHAAESAGGSRDVAVARTVRDVGDSRCCARSGQT